MLDNMNSQALSSTAYLRVCKCLSKIIFSVVTPASAK